MDTSEQTFILRLRREALLENVSRPVGMPVAQIELTGRTELADLVAALRSGEAEAQPAV